MYSWLLLLYIQFNVKRSIYELWIFQVITLRMVGMAFEVNLAYKSKLGIQDSAKILVHDGAPMKMVVDPSRTHSSTSISTAGGSTAKEVRENAHTKTGDVPADVGKQTSAHGRASITPTPLPTAGRASTTSNALPTAGRASITPTPLSTALRPSVTPSSSVTAKRSSVKGEVHEKIPIPVESQRECLLRVANTILDSDVIDKEPTAVDIISYAYFFIGLHKGKELAPFLRLVKLCIVYNVDK